MKYFISWSIFAVISFCEAHIDQKRSHSQGANDLKDKIKDPKLPTRDEVQFYLPTESYFLSPQSLSAFSSVTSPPNLVIKPSSAAFVSQPTTAIEDVHVKDDFPNNDIITPYSSQCMKETTSLDEASSKENTENNVVLSGYVETASKTSNLRNPSKLSHSASGPSIVLQGSHVYMPSASDA